MYQMYYFLVFVNRNTWVRPQRIKADTVTGKSSRNVFYIRFSHHQTVESGLYDRIIEAKGTDSVGGEFFARRDGGSHETLTDYRRDAYRPDI